MAETLYIMHAVDEWEEYRYVYGAYSSREKAVADLMEDHDDLIYDDRYDRWTHLDLENTQYFYIQEITVK